MPCSCSWWRQRLACQAGSEPTFNKWRAAFVGRGIVHEPAGAEPLVSRKKNELLGEHFARAHGPLRDFLGEGHGEAVFLLIVEVICVPLFFFFLGNGGCPPRRGVMFAAFGGRTIGIAGIGTLLSTITINTRGKTLCSRCCSFRLCSLAVGVRFGDHGRWLAARK